MSRTLSQSLRRAEAHGAVIKTDTYPHRGRQVRFCPRSLNHDPKPWLVWPGWQDVSDDYFASDFVRYSARECYAEARDGSPWPVPKVTQKRKAHR